MTARSQSRKHRGMRTQALVARRWVESRLFPHATDTGSGRPGKDILNTPGLLVEVKARTTISLVSLLKGLRNGAQLELDGLELRPVETCIVIWRHDGQGELSIQDWTVTMSLEDFERLWRKANDDR